VSFTKLLESWPLVRQLREGDPLGLGKAVQSPHSKQLKARIDQADDVVRSICPYCAVGCAQLVYVKDGEVTQIEGDPASPISRGRLCPKGSASKNYVQSPLREYRVKYRRPKRTLGIAPLGGATLDNEENYLMKKLLTATGVVQVENQARI
jgi:formate dehydrogenase major subunit